MKCVRWLHFQLELLEKNIWKNLFLYTEKKREPKGEKNCGKPHERPQLFILKYQTEMYISSIMMPTTQLLQLQKSRAEKVPERYNTTSIKQKWLRCQFHLLGPDHEALKVIFHPFIWIYGCITSPVLSSDNILYWALNLCLVFILKLVLIAHHHKGVRNAKL